jgi:hypothetical protein
VKEKPQDKLLSVPIVACRFFGLDVH